MQTASASARVGVGSGTRKKVTIIIWISSNGRSVWTNNYIISTHKSVGVGVDSTGVGVGSTGVGVGSTGVGVGSGHGKKLQLSFGFLPTVVPSGQITTSSAHTRGVGVGVDSTGVGVGSTGVGVGSTGVGVACCIGMVNDSVFDSRNNLPLSKSNADS